MDISRTTPPHFLWNAVAFVVDYSSVGIALAFVSLSSVMPAFVRLLMASAPLVGLVPTLFNAGWTLPQLAAARLVHDKPRKKPYVLMGLVGRLCPWIVAGALWRGLAQQREAMLALFFTCLTLFAFGEGFSSPAWCDILARAIPSERRGRVIGIAQALVGLGGLGAGGIVSLVLVRRPFPINYAILFALWGACLIPSTVALFLLREPPPVPSSDLGLSATAVRTPLLKSLAADRTFRRLLLSRIAFSIAGLSATFYVVHATDALRLPASMIGAFVIAQTFAGVLGSTVLGWISDRRGARSVILIGALQQ